MVATPPQAQPASQSRKIPIPPAPITSLADVAAVAEKIRVRMRAAVMGRDDVIELVLVALFGDGHILLEDYPGSGKTTLAKALGASIIDDLENDDIPDFRRVQFTPDLLPSDITGVMVFDTATSTFHFRRGPVFAYVLLVDEINRASPKVQSALLEAMAEKQVTVDNVTHPLNELFFVMATQNPLDAVGTYPLPFAQLDRFLFKVKMQHVSREAELEVLRTWGHPQARPELPRVTRGEVVTARQLLRSVVHVSPLVHECLVDIVRALRADKRVLQGGSTRCLVQSIPALQTLAMLRGRDFVSPEDIAQLVVPLFQHRLDPAPGADPVQKIIGEAIARPLDALARATLQRG